MYNKALSEYPDNYNAYLFRGRLYFYSHHFEEAKDDLENSIRINPNGDSITYSDLSKLYAIVYKDYKKSVEYATKSLKLNSLTNTNAYLNRAIAFLYLKEYDKAISDFESVLKINPKNSSAVIGMAHGHRLLGQYDKAINELNLLLNTDAEQSQVFYWLSACYENKGDKKMAEHCFKKYQELQINKKSSDK
jgi:tetratricopeptide (TPR) repeat protein